MSNEDIESLQRMKGEIKSHCKRHSKNELIAYITSLLWENAQLRAEHVQFRKNMKETYESTTDNDTNANLVNSPGE